jgi:predicted small integral membrane protein
MTPVQMRAIGLGLAGVVVFGTGVWLTRTGRPYDTALTTVHKLVDAAAVIVIGVMTYQAQRSSPLTALEWTVIVAAAVLTIALFATGGVASAIETPPTWVLALHRVAPWLAGILAIAAVHMLGRR